MSAGPVRQTRLFGKSGYLDVLITVTAYNNTAIEDSVISFVTPRGTLSVTEGVDWSFNDTSNTVTAGNIATAIAALDGFDAEIATSGTVVYVKPEPWVEISSATWTKSGVAVAAGGTIAATQTDHFVSCANGKTRISNPVLVGDAEYFTAYIGPVTVDGAGTPSFTLEHRTVAEVVTKLIDPSNGDISSDVVWGPWSSATSFSGSDGATFEYGSQFNPGVGPALQIRFTNSDATNAITATATTGLKGTIQIA